MSIRSYTLGEIGALLAAKLQGDPNCLISGLMTLQEAGPGQLTFLDNRRYRRYLANTRASAVILHEKHLSECPTNALVLANPYVGFAKVATLFQPPPDWVIGIHPTAVIAERCQIHPSVSIGPYVVIGADTTLAAGVVMGPGCCIAARVSIGERSLLSSNVTLYADTQVGRDVIIHSGAVIGSDGFGLAHDGVCWHKIPQLGKVLIGHHVEIGANVTIDRGALGDTVLADGVKLDNQVQIAHNVSIGENTAIAGCTGIAGSTRIGRNCLIGGGTCINGHLEIVDNVTIAGMSGVNHSIRQAGTYASALPIQPRAIWRKNVVRFKQLDKMARQLKRAERLKAAEE